jgi:cytochrome bd-type quinol oxidase subunit 2
MGHAMTGLALFILAKPPRGDMTFIGWTITFAYFVCAGLCFWAGRKEKEQALGRARRWHAPVFWFTLCGVLVALGFNKQLDLQSDLTQIGRDMAKSEGWYGHRRVVQAVFVVVFAAAAIGAVAGAIWFMRDLWRRYRLAFVGIIYLCAFVIIRAASFHHIDTLLYHLPGVGEGINTILELGGNVLIGWAAIKAARHREEPKLRAFEVKVKIR